MTQEEITHERMRSIPRIGTTSSDATKTLVHERYFLPVGKKIWRGWRLITGEVWYVTEFDGDDECFGFQLVGKEIHIRFFRLSDLRARGFERSTTFEKKTVSAVLDDWFGRVVD